MKIAIFILFITLISGCEEEKKEIWVEAEQDDFQHALQFMEDYMEVWQSSLQEQQGFSPVEHFFIANSHVYHMQRRQHQQLSGKRIVELFEKSNREKLEVNQFEEFRWTWTEFVNVKQGDLLVQEEREKTYYLLRTKDSFKITAIERNDEN